MTRTPDEIKEGLECCQKSFAFQDCGSRCPYYRERSCGVKLYGDALALIQQLQAENAERAERIRELYAYVGEANKNLDCLQAKLGTKLDSVEAGVVRLFQYCKELQAERDALIDAVKDWGGACATCKHYSNEPDGIPCRFCIEMHPEDEDRISHWQWRGVQKD